ncbi:MAG: DUF2334 domain-containing protein [archaeon]|nr:DUF2334 domain-containing protein [archaeon]
MFICVTSDDLQPQTLPLFEKYWKPLKEKHHDLLVTFFVAPYNQEFGQGEENDVSKSESFKKWFEENKDWCEVEIHGYDHTKPPENQRSIEEQDELIQKSIDIMKPFIDDTCLGYKSPFYRMNQNTIKILQSYGFSWYSQWWSLIPLNVINKKIPDFFEIGTHTSLPEGKNPDNIDVFYDQLDWTLTTLESKGCTYSTLRRIMKEVLK